MKDPDLRKQVRVLSFLGLVVAFWVDGEFSEELSGDGVDDGYVEVLMSRNMAGAVCPVEVMRRCVDEMHMSEVSIAYGMTETSPVSCQTRIDDDLERRTSTIGWVAPHVEIKIIDPATGITVERGESRESSAPAATQ